MWLMPLFSGAKENGYMPSKVQKSALECLHGGGSVIVQAMLDGESSTANVMSCADVKKRRPYVQGRIATFCLGALNGIRSSRLKCRCLIITSGMYANGIVEEMKILGKNLPRKIKVKHVYSKSYAHIAVGYISNTCPFVTSHFKILPDDIEMIVFDWGIYECKDMIVQTESICKCLNISERFQQGKVQLAVFSENKMSDKDCEELLLKAFGANHSSFELLDEKADRWCTLERIEKHQIVDANIYAVPNLENEDYDNHDKHELKVKAIMDLIPKNLTELSRTIVVVGGFSQFHNVVTELKKNSIQFAEPKEGMSGMDRGKVVEDFLSFHLLITTPIWHRDMPSAYFDSHVCSIINYDCCGYEEYVLRVGLFKEVDTVITLVDPYELLFPVLDMQDTCDLLFQRMNPICVVKTRTEEIEKQKHHATLVETNIMKDAELMYSLFKNILMAVAGGTHSVIFVEKADVGKNLVEQMEKVFPKSTTFTTSVLKVTKMMNTGQSFVLITTDDAIDSETDNVVNQMKENMHVVINYDMPSQIKYYQFRVGLCKRNGVVVHLATYCDWLNLFDMQAFLGVSVKDFRWHTVCNYLKNTYPESPPMDVVKDQSSHTPEKKMNKLLTCENSTLLSWTQSN